MNEMLKNLMLGIKVDVVVHCMRCDKSKKTYNTRHSLVVTDPTTTRALTGLAIGERTGPGVFSWLWSHVLIN